MLPHVRKKDKTITVFESAVGQSGPYLPNQAVNKFE